MRFHTNSKRCKSDVFSWRNGLESEKRLISVGEQGLVTKHAKIVGILVRVVEGSSDVAAAVKLFTYIASYVSQ